MSKTIDPTSDDKLTFEEAMAELDELVSRMEDGELSLDDSNYGVDRTPRSLVQQFAFSARHVGQFRPYFRRSRLF